MTKITAKLRNGAPGASRDALLGTVIAGRLSGALPEGFSSDAMAWGNATEPLARAAYQLDRLIRVEQVGCILHPTIDNTLASPDGLVGDNGCLEIKCPMTHNHLETLLSGTVPSKYMQQMQWQMACTGMIWCDFVSFDPRLPERMQLWVKRVYRDESVIAMLEKEVNAFLLEVEKRLYALNQRYPREVPHE